MTCVKAIETEYNGYRFRSRLEARWAVFFDAANIKYEYEPEGFESPDGTRYLPDFYLPEYDWYVEVKPPRPGAFEDIERASRFVGEKIKVLLLLGNIPPKRDIEFWHFSAMYYNPLQRKVCIERCCVDVAWAEDQDSYSRLEFTSWLFVDRKYHEDVWTLRRIPDRLKEVLTAMHDEEITTEQDDGSKFCWSDNFGENRIKALSAPYKKARQARFEFGEKGA